MEFEKLLRKVVGENYNGTLKILRDEEIDIDAFYALDSAILEDIGRFHVL